MEIIETLGIASAIDETKQKISVDLEALDELVKFAGELVINRNRLLKLADIHGESIPELRNIVQSMNLLTSGIYDRIIQTRLQPVEVLLAKVVNRLTGFNVELPVRLVPTESREEVRLDGAMIEALVVPITAICQFLGTSPFGLSSSERISVSIRQGGGQVWIDITGVGSIAKLDELRGQVGIDSFGDQHELGFEPEREASPLFFTSELESKLFNSDQSLLLVRDQIEQVGGTVELLLCEEEALRFVLHLRQTHTIISAMIVKVNGFVYAIPQSNVVELVRLTQKNSIEVVHDNQVFRLRDSLIAVVDLGELLSEKDPSPSDFRKCRNGYILVMKHEDRQFALRIDELLDSEEISLIPSGKYLSSIPCYSGASILANGNPSMILDVEGIIEMTALDFDGVKTDHEKVDDQPSLQQEGTRGHALLLFENGTEECFGLDLSIVARIEKVQTQSIERIGDRTYIKIGTNSLRIIYLHEFMPVSEPAGTFETIYIIIPKHQTDQPIGLVASKIVDSVEVHQEYDQTTIQGIGILGSLYLQEKLILSLNLYSLLQAADPEGFCPSRKVVGFERWEILMFDESPVFSLLEKQFFEEFVASVTLAKSLEEVGTLAGSQSYPLFVLGCEKMELEMVEFLKELKQKPSLKNSMFILLTQLAFESPEMEDLELIFDGIASRFNGKNVAETLEDLLEKVGEQSCKIELIDSLYEDR